MDKDKIIHYLELADNPNTSMRTAIGDLILAITEMIAEDTHPAPQPAAQEPRCPLVCLGCKHPLTISQNQQPDYDVGILTGDYEITCEECGWILYVPANDEDEANAQYARITGQAGAQ